MSKNRWIILNLKTTTESGEKVISHERPYIVLNGVVGTTVNGICGAPTSFSTTQNSRNYRFIDCQQVTHASLYLLSDTIDIDKSMLRVGKTYFTNTTAWDSITIMYRTEN